MKTQNRFWNFVNLGNDETEVQIYGDISSRKSVDFWTGEKGDEVTPNDFLKELEEVTTNKICFRINSNGGDVFAANAIAIAIEELANAGKEIACKIDGICASAAVRVALACPKVTIAKGAYMMIHKPMSGMCGYYNSDEMRKKASTLDTIQSGIVSVYSERTGLSVKECEKLMDAETWFTAEEAVEKGFANDILFVDEVEENTEEVLDKIKNAFVASATMCDPTKVPKALKEAFDNKNTKNEEGKNPMEFKNITDLKNAFPDLIANAETEARNKGAEEERARLKAIDGLAGKIDNTLLNEAKYGATKMTADEIIVKAFKEDKMLGKGYLNACEEDTKDSDKVKVDGEDDETKDETEEEKVTDSLVNIAKNCRKAGGTK